MFYLFFVGDVNLLLFFFVVVVVVVVRAGLGCFFF